ncbi:MAG: 30S ribosomal protein S19e [Candidatus Micrarchaeota archaeon]|nr:30S ribosomal protein S19e [Candidatus Micrarchaeota archaeon]
MVILKRGIEMITAFDVEPNKLIKGVAEKLKQDKVVMPPEWIYYVKSGAHRERVPQDEDFWYVRCASILRALYIDGPMGVSTLRERFGGKPGSKSGRMHATKAGGSIIRKALQQLEKANLISKDKKGRFVTKKGISLLNSVAKQVAKQ